MNKKPRNITIQNCNITTKPSAQEEIQLEIIKAIHALILTLNNPQPSYGVYIQGDTYLKDEDAD